MVMITLGPAGLLVATRQTGVLRRPGRTVEVIDMVGAGGACMSALLAGLHRRGLLGAARRFMLEGLGHAARTEPLR
jgi:fructokinase